MTIEVDPMFKEIRVKVTGPLKKSKIEFLEAMRIALEVSDELHSLGER